MSSDKYYYNINIGDFNLIYYDEYKKRKFDCLAYKQFDILPALKDGDSWIVAEHYATAQAGSCFLEKS